MRTYDDILRFETGGDTTEKKTMTFQRDTLYQEIWEISLSKVAKKYDVPYDKLKAACVKANIPLPSQSYWGNLYIGKPVQKTPLPDSAVTEDVRIEREKREEAKRKAEEERRQKELRRQKYNDEVDKLQALNNAARDYETACRLRAYVAAVESTPELDTETLDWIAWAKAKADWHDPTVAATDPVFGKRNHRADPNNKTPTKKSSYFY